MLIIDVRLFVNIYYQNSVVSNTAVTRLEPSCSLQMPRADWCARVTLPQHGFRRWPITVEHFDSVSSREFQPRSRRSCSHPVIPVYGLSVLCFTLWSVCWYFNVSFWTRWL